MLQIIKRHKGNHFSVPNEIVKFLKKNKQMNLHQFSYLFINQTQISFHNNLNSSHTQRKCLDLDSLLLSFSFTIDTLPTSTLSPPVTFSVHLWNKYSAVVGNKSRKLRSAIYYIQLKSEIYYIQLAVQAAVGTNKYIINCKEKHVLFEFNE